MQESKKRSAKAERALAQRADVSQAEMRTQVARQTSRGSSLAFFQFLEAFFFTKKPTTATMALRMMTEKVMGFAAKQYQSALGASLATTGKLSLSPGRHVGASAE